MSDRKFLEAVQIHYIVNCTISETSGIAFTYIYKRIHFETDGQRKRVNTKSKGKEKEREIELF